MLSTEIIESALRLAISKRDERSKSGQLIFRQSLNLARSRKKGEEIVVGTDEDMFYPEDTALWQKAKRLALARLRRGKNNWMKARSKVISDKGSDQSFWHKAKNIVFTPHQKKKDKKVVKIL